MAAWHGYYVIIAIGSQWLCSIFFIAVHMFIVYNIPKWLFWLICHEGRTKEENIYVYLDHLKDVFFFGGAGVWVENEKVWARPKNIHRTIFPGNIYIHISRAAPRPQNISIWVGASNPLWGATDTTNSAGADVLRLLGAMGPLTSLLSGEAHMGAMAVTERCIGATYPTRVKKNTWHLKRCGLINLKEQVFHIFWVHRMVTTTDPKDRPFWLLDDSTFFESN